MDLTTSFDAVVPAQVRARFELRETRNAAAILAATNRKAFREFLAVLDGFTLTGEDITVPGGQESTVAKRLNRAFRRVGWREGKIDMTVALLLRVMPYRDAGETESVTEESEVINEGYHVDNVKGRLALDVEWNAKDGNLDRDVAAYRALYDTGLIDGAIMVTRSFESIRQLSIRLGRPKGFGTTTTTTLEKLEPRLTRGDGGGCPILAVAITDRCYAP